MGQDRKAVGRDCRLIEGRGLRQLSQPAVTTCGAKRSLAGEAAIRHLARVAPGSQGTLGDLRRNAAPPQEEARGLGAERALHAQGFGHGSSAGAVLPSVGPAVIPGAAAAGQGFVLCRSKLVLQFLDVAHDLANQIQVSLHSLVSFRVPSASRAVSSIVARPRGTPLDAALSVVFSNN